MHYLRKISLRRKSESNVPRMVLIYSYYARSLIDVLGSFIKAELTKCTKKSVHIFFCFENTTPAFFRRKSFSFFVKYIFAFFSGRLRHSSRRVHHPLLCQRLRRPHRVRLPQLPRHSRPEAQEEGEWEQVRRKILENISGELFLQQFLISYQGSQEALHWPSTN